jgi:hypothetical protein
VDQRLFILITDITECISEIIKWDNESARKDTGRETVSFSILSVNKERTNPFLFFLSAFVGGTWLKQRGQLGF